jgi:hypothetical protein
LPEASRERENMTDVERVALDRAVRKLAILGPELPFPHQSSVRGERSLRELRPRAGRSPRRALYRRIGTVFVIAAIGPEAGADASGFLRAVAGAVKRLREAHPL